MGIILTTEYLMHLVHVTPSVVSISHHYRQVGRFHLFTFHRNYKCKRVLGKVNCGNINCYLVATLWCHLPNSSLLSSCPKSWVCASVLWSNSSTNSAAIWMPPSFSICRIFGSADLGKTMVIGFLYQSAKNIRLSMTPTSSAVRLGIPACHNLISRIMMPPFL